MSTLSSPPRSRNPLRLPCLLLLLLAHILLPAALLAQGSGFWHTSGSLILDSNNQQVRIAGINWYGFETTRGVAGGLTSRDYKAILQTIKTQGYNTIRIPLSNQVVETPQIPSSISYSNGINSDLSGLNSLQILDRIVSYAGTLNLRVILDNHRSEAGDSAEANGLWFTGAYPESAWINDWKNLASRYAGNTTVIGVDLRNEPHNAYSGGACWDCGGANDWHLAAQRAGNAVLAVNPNLLIFVEGTDAYNNDYYWWGGNLQGVKNSPVTLSIPNHLVYSPHEYGPREYQQWWFNSSTSYSSLYSVWLNHWGFVNQNSIAPVWVGEFGTTNNSSDIQNNTPGSEGQWFQSLIQYLGSDTRLHWTYWAVNGEDAYGLLDSSYGPYPVSALKQQSLASLQSPLGSSSGSGTTSPPATNNPNPPTGVTATAASSSQINLQWQASSTSGVVYQVYASTTSNFAPSSSTLVAQNISSTSFQATNLSASTTWYFVVQSVKNGYGSDYSARASATTLAAAAPPPPPASTTACHVDYTNQNDWGSGFTGGVVITNTGTTSINGWNLVWAYSGNQLLNQSWNSTYSQNGQVVTLTNASWNGAIPAGGTQSGIGFNATYSGTNTNPGNFYLNGTLCR
ncbi:MAG: hypothetical protein NVSMB3_09710 [Acidobacteriaceae bacterium]